jgi:hypothetical protein
MRIRLWDEETSGTLMRADAFYRRRRSGNIPAPNLSEPFFPGGSFRQAPWWSAFFSVLEKRQSPAALVVAALLDQQSCAHRVRLTTGREDSMAYGSSSTLTLAIALLVHGGAALAGPLAACPQKGGLLESASVFDGPPEKLVELMPDFATLEWDLAAGQESARARGESIYLVCKYKGAKSTVKIKLAHEAALCKAEGIKNRTVISCSAASKDGAISSQ